MQSIRDILEEKKKKLELCRSKKSRLKWVIDRVFNMQNCKAKGII
jgi:hypothetical protein